MTSLVFNLKNKKNNKPNLKIKRIDGDCQMQEHGGGCEKLVKEVEGDLKKDNRGGKKMMVKKEQ